MTFIDSSSRYAPSTLTPQMRHFNAAERSEKAAKHHRTAARLHDAGDHEQARIYAKFARKHAVAALMACSVESEPCGTGVPGQFAASSTLLTLLI